MSWYIDFANVDKSQLKVFLNIGFNKGYNFALWMNIFNPSSNITTSVWYEALRKYGKINDCGFCQDCKYQYTRKTLEDSELIMIGVDLIPGNVKAVSKVMEGFINEKSYNFDNLQLYTMHAAGTRMSKLVKMPSNCPQGYEACHISNIPNDPDIQGISIDHLIDELKSQEIIQYNNTIFHNKHKNRNVIKSHKPAIDMILIDTEGNDPDVIKGAVKTLYNKDVRCFIFEYHEVGLWQQYDLGDVISELDKLDYECYFTGSSRVFPISGEIKY